ncbi:MAG: hypothetical protein OEZ25_07430, partial [Candidatus Bathyarchaeota archaeon]|nr:hypothetical protein [Candidatus Bathyarchaeota archaeon]
TIGTTLMVEADGYILRIATKEWVDQVFNLAIYYTGTRRKWKMEQIIIFVHKTSMGDAIIGYGEIGNIYASDELSEEERRECEKRGWKKAIELKYIIRFDKPLPIKETFLKSSKLRGRSLHGFPLNKEQLDSIINKAEQLQSQTP